MVRIADDIISVRRAGRDDLGQVLALYRLLDGPYAVAGKTVTEEEAWRTLAGDHRQYLMVAEDGGRVVGTATIIIIANIGHGGKPWAAVENVVVDEEYRGRSVGTRLMIAVGDIARRLGCYKLVLSSNATRVEAHEFYRRLGWRQTHAGFSLEVN
jgi:GNAT superfamily N-acetyltransferase